MVVHNFLIYFTKLFFYCCDEANLFLLHKATDPRYMTHHSSDSEKKEKLFNLILFEQHFTNHFVQVHE